MTSNRHVTCALALSFFVSFFVQEAYCRQASESLVPVERKTLHSRLLNEERAILVHLPEGYGAGQSSYPVLYILDAEWEELFVHAVTTAAYLNEFGAIPKLIVVGILNTNRDRDMIPVKLTDRPHSGGSDQFLGFITDELMPYIKDGYRTQPYNLLYGGSNAGLFALYAFLEEPQAVDASIASSPMIGHCRDHIYERTQAFLEKKEPFRNFLYLVYGEDDYPKVVDFVPEYHRYLDSNKPSFAYDVNILEGEGHVPFTSLYSGLRFVFSDWTFPEAQVPEATLEQLKEHFRRVSTRYGFESEIPLDLLIGLGYRSLQKEEIIEAIETLKFAVLAHPYSPDAHYYLAEAYEKDGKKGLALEHCQTALDIDPHYRMAADKIASLKRTEQRR